MARAPGAVWVGWMGLWVCQGSVVCAGGEVCWLGGGVVGVGGRLYCSWLCRLRLLVPPQPSPTLPTPPQFAPAPKPITPGAGRLDRPGGPGAHQGPPAQRQTHDARVRRVPPVLGFGSGVCVVRWVGGGEGGPATQCELCLRHSSWGMGAGTVGTAQVGAAAAAHAAWAKCPRLSGSYKQCPPDILPLLLLQCTCASPVSPCVQCMAGLCHMCLLYSAAHC